MQVLEAPLEDRDVLPRQLGGLLLLLQGNPRELDRLVRIGVLFLLAWSSFRWIPNCCTAGGLDEALRARRVLRCASCDLCTVGPSTQAATTDSTSLISTLSRSSSSEELELGSAAAPAFSAIRLSFLRASASCFSSVASLLPS